MTTDGSGLLVIERILRNRQGIWQQIVEDRDLTRLTGRMLASSAIALACYGAVLGAFHSFLMALTSAVKLPLLFLVTLAICLPTLYFFNLVFGARLSLRQALSLVMVAITVTSMLAVAFAPISLFFLITAPDYGFFKLLNVAILTLSALVGLRFLTGGMQVLNVHGLLAPKVADRAGPTATPAGLTTTPPPISAQGTTSTQGTTPDNGATLDPAGSAGPVPAIVNGGGAAGAVAAPVQPVMVTAPVQPVMVAAPVQPVATLPVPGSAPGLVPVGHGHYAMAMYPPGAYRPAPVPAAQRPASMTLLYVWILLFGFVGTQLAWTLRPFFGSPGESFAIFRGIEGNFYAEIVRTIGSLF